MSAREAWRRLIAGEPGDQVLVDLGTTTVSGLAAAAAPDLAESVGSVGHPVLQNIAFSSADTTAIGSDFARSGFLFERPEVVDDTFLDQLGVRWLWSDNSAAPLDHPLQEGNYLDAARYPRPDWPSRLQAPAGDEAAARLAVADAPCSGVLETCFGLRNSWQFMVDVTDNWRVANALLDWSLETVATGYERMLTALPTQPDVVLYGDDYGYQGGMFLSDDDFRTFIRPRLRTLFARIRRVTGAAICFHCCGAVSPILPDLADLGVELLNLQYDAKGMELHKVRAVVPSSLVLHGYTDLVALGRAVEGGDRGSIAILAEEMALSGATIAAPTDNLGNEADFLRAARAAAFVHAVGPEGFAELRSLGPVATVLDRAALRAMAQPIQRPAGHPPAAFVGGATNANDPQPAR